MNLDNLKLEIDNIKNKTNELGNLVGLFEKVIIIGNGGSNAMASHISVDYTKFLNKKSFSFSDAPMLTAYINDYGRDEAYKQFLKNFVDGNTLVILISSSGNSKDVINALQWASDNGMETCVLTAKPIPGNIKGLTQIILGVDYYHTAECLTLLLQYQLTHGSGKECPPIVENSPEDLQKLNWNKGIRKHSYPDELIQIGIDFDGVIHKNSKGYYDGTIYDDPIEGTEESLKRLSEKYTLILYTTKAKPDRGLINGRPTIELIWEWLDKHNLSKYISKITSEKPRAVAYIDDKAVRFHNWDKCLENLEVLNLI